MLNAHRKPNSEQRRFGLRFVAILAPLFALYTFPYRDNGVAEHWFSNYLSGYARLAGGALSLIEPGVRVFGQDIVGRFALRIIKSCDAMEAVFLFVAAVLAFPTTWPRRLLGLSIGGATIVGLNVLRICSLYYVGVYQPREFEFYHLEVWPLILVGSAGLAFYAWLHWATQPQA